MGEAGAQNRGLHLRAKTGRVKIRMHGHEPLYDNEQIPVAVDGKMYYGCCQMCEAKLKEGPSPDGDRPRERQGWISLPS
jgi:hypothetical protein